MPALMTRTSMDELDTCINFMFFSTAELHVVPIVWYIAYNMNSVLYTMYSTTSNLMDVSNSSDSSANYFFTSNSIGQSKLLNFRALIKPDSTC